MGKTTKRQAQPMTHADMQQELRERAELAELQHNTRKTNLERVTQFMEYGSPMNQMFVMTALIKMVEATLADPEGLKSKMEENESAKFISPEAWIACAAEFKKQNPELFK
jgi:hypothetical protein